MIQKAPVEAVHGHGEIFPVCASKRVHKLGETRVLRELGFREPPEDRVDCQGKAAAVMHMREEGVMRQE